MLGRLATIVLLFASAYKKKSRGSVMIENFLKKWRELIRKILVNNKNIRNLKCIDFSIISSDCTGGVLSHDLNLQFLSPTINMFFSAQDFIKFLNNIRAYLQYEFVDITTENDSWPVAKVGDIYLQLVHYKSVLDAQQAWDRRKERINWNKICVIMNDRNGCTEKELIEFEKLNYKNKIFLTCNKEWCKKYKCAYYISKSEVNNDNGQQTVKTIPSYVPKLGWHRVIDEFDYIEFFNKIEMSESDSVKDE